MPHRFGKSLTPAAPAGMEAQQVAALVLLCSGGSSCPCWCQSPSMSVLAANLLSKMAKPPVHPWPLRQSGRVLLVQLGRGLSMHTGSVQGERRASGPCLHPIPRPAVPGPPATRARKGIPLCLVLGKVEQTGWVTQCSFG